MAALFALITDGLGWSFPAQAALYLPGGILSLVLVSRLTRPEPKDRLNAFYSLLNTPVGAEHRLHGAGIEIIHERDEEATDRLPWSAPPRQSTDAAAEDGVAGDGSVAATRPIVAVAEARAVLFLKDARTASRGESLLLVNMLTLKKGFSWRRYRVDLRGFTVSWAVVAVYLAVVFVLAYLCRTA